MLAVDTTEARWRRSESNRHLPRCKRGARPVELHPPAAEKARCGRVESNHHSLRRRGYSALSSPVLSVRTKVARVGLEPTSRAHEAREEAAPPPRDVAPGPGREVWPAGVEPAISGAQNRRGGHLPYSQRTRTRPWRRPGSRRPWNRTTLHRRIRAALAQPARRRWGVARESHPAPRIHSPRARYKPCDADSPGGVEPPSPAVEARRSSI